MYKHIIGVLTSNKVYVYVHVIDVIRSSQVLGTSCEVIDYAIRADSC